MIPHNPPRTATEGSGTVEASALSSAALSAQVVAARAIIEGSFDAENFIYGKGQGEDHISPKYSTTL